MEATKEVVRAHHSLLDGHGDDCSLASKAESTDALLGPLGSVGPMTRDVTGLYDLLTRLAPFGTVIALRAATVFHWLFQIGTESLCFD